MRREVSLEEISDGKLYGLNDMVKADCYDCKGCSSCCKGMGGSIILTPYDIYLLTTGLHTSFEELLRDGKIEMNIVDGIILPNLKMAGREEACAFLDENGRCSVHGIRPGICRLFPLGRIYEEDGVKYFLQIHECRNRNRGKIKVSKWLDTPRLKDNEAFILRWHDLVKNFTDYLREDPEEETAKKLNMLLLRTFYVMPYTEDDFYEQIEKRFAMI